jgi:hypothetical protein
MSGVKVSIRPGAEKPVAVGSEQARGADAAIWYA